MIYLYAVTEAPPRGFRGLGLEGEPVLSLTCSGLHLAHSLHRSGFEPAVTPDALWTHEAVVDELLQAGPVVPFRFGTTLADSGAAETYLTRQAGRFHRLLAGLRGKVELAVRLTLARDEEPGDGKSYLRRRARERDLLQPLASLAAAGTTRAGARVLRASYLVSREDVQRFAVAVGELQEAHPGVTLSCTGPWAPYSFVEDSR
jgi:hypothetical protein